MKILLLILVLSAAVLCQDDKAMLIPLDARFTEDAKVEMSKDRLSPEMRAQINLKFEPSLIQMGTKNGVRYRFYHVDGSGSFEGNQGAGLDLTHDNIGTFEYWSVGCEKDPIDDSKRCTMSRGDLLVVRSTNFGTSVLLIGDKDPGSEVAIRVDGKPAFRASERNGFIGTKADEVIAALSSGERVVTRYVSWPQKTNKDRTQGLHGFKEALAYLDWALKQIK